MAFGSDVLSEDVIEIILDLHSFFQDSKKVELWLHTENLNLGGLAPAELILRGRAKKLRIFVETALDENGGKGIESGTKT